MLTAQDVFDKAATHLLKQGKKALRTPGGVSCLYRTDDGLKCAAGALIDDSAYSELIEGKAAYHSDVTAALRASGVSADDVELVMALQNLHDNYDPEMWSFELQGIARKFGLATTLLP